MSLQNFIHKKTAQTFAIYPLALASVNSSGQRMWQITSQNRYFFCGNHEEKLSQQRRKKFMTKMWICQLERSKKLSDVAIPKKKKEMFSLDGMRESALNTTPIPFDEFKTKRWEKIELQTRFRVTIVGGENLRRYCIRFQRYEVESWGC